MITVYFKMIKYIFLIFGLIYSCIVYSNSVKQEKIKASLKELDSYIEERNYYAEEKEKRISLLHNDLNIYKNNEIQKLDIYDLLFEEYKSYKYDSAYVYAQKCLESAILLKDKRKIAHANEHIAFCYLSAGLFKEAYDIMTSININEIPDSLRISYYTLFARLNYDMADYIEIEPLRSNYIEAGNNYSDSAIIRLPIESPELWAILGLKRMQQQNMKGAIEVFQRLIKTNDIDDHTYAIATSSLGFVYDEAGNTDEAIYYMSQAAIGDIKSATKETVAMRNLANLLYNAGDINSANRYIRLAMEDADSYNARHRKIVISSILPIIEKERFDMVEKQRNILFRFMLIISLLFVLLLAITIFTYKQYKKLKDARLTIENQNNKLLSANSKLVEANKIKDEYIVQSLYGNSEYIDKTENLYKVIKRKIMARQYDDILSQLKESDLRKERENMHLSFDRTFLKLFPDFISEYNKLFSPEDAVETDPSKGLTPEIRIFALIRLGINESDRIAKFLNYSVNTINTYKTKAKNKSIIPNELFEQKIMDIKTVRAD